MQLALHTVTLQVIPVGGFYVSIAACARREGFRKVNNV